ncbi:MAG: hypothetical protein P4M00_11605 [Azospirillaceae bacterium]|nr:hypothetical protein [Azospirillaceae bacterium]
MGWHGYLVGGAMILVAALLKGLFGSNSVQVRGSISGIFIGRDNSGSITQVQHNPAPRPEQAARAKANGADRVAWTLSGIGIVIMAAQLALALLERP